MPQETWDISRDSAQSERTGPWLKLKVAISASEPSLGEDVQKSNRRGAAVDAFLLECNRRLAAGSNVRRKHIWLAAGHANARQFQYWQRGSDKATEEDARNFRRILSMPPGEFLALLKKKSIL